MPKPLIMTEEQLRESLKAHKPAPEGQLRKGFIAEIKAMDDDRTIDFVISTDSVDRMGDTIAVDGWQLANFRKNPVVLWAHDSSMMPVAKASNVRVEDGKLKARAEFMPREISGFADAVFRAIKGGFLNAVSVGFMPVKYAFSEEDGRSFGIDFLIQELMEFSVCPIPANPDALVEARSAGIDMDPIREWAEKMLASGGLSVIQTKQIEALRALPAKWRSIGKSMAPTAKGAQGNFRRCANDVEEALKAAETKDDSYTPCESCETPDDCAAAGACAQDNKKAAETEVKTPRLATARAFLDLARHTIN